MSVPCNQYHSGYNVNGSIRWKCVAHLTWEVDLSQCVFVQNNQEELDFALFLYQIPLTVDVIPASLLRTSVSVRVLPQALSNSRRPTTHAVYLIVQVL